LPATVRKIGTPSPPPAHTNEIFYVLLPVPTNKNFALNVFLQDVPPADDYFLVFLNHTHGFTYTVSDRFTILDSSSSSSAAGALTSAATITVSGGPNPTAQFVTTFPASAASKLTVHGWRTGAAAMAAAVALCALAGALAVL
jgi:hypothetical protein